MRAYVLSSVSEPPQRLLVSQSALPLPMIIAGMMWFLTNEMVAIGAYILSHGAVIALSSYDPYFVEVMRARFQYKRTKRQLPQGGNLYGA